MLWQIWDLIGNENIYSISAKLRNISGSNLFCPVALLTSYFLTSVFHGCFIWFNSHKRFPSSSVFSKVLLDFLSFRSFLITLLHVWGSSPNFAYSINLLNANLTKWSNTLKQFVSKLTANCLTNLWDWRLKC